MFEALLATTSSEGLKPLGSAAQRSFELVTGTVRHRLGHMARAVMEGVAFGLRDSVELMAAEMELGEVRVSGGGASSDLWLRIIADVIGLPVRVVGTAESAAHGAAMLAAVGAGAFTSVAEACETAVELGEFTDPGRDVAIYTDVYRVYRDLYPALSDSFRRLSGLDT